jgi:hypothetical protein
MDSGYTLRRNDIVNPLERELGGGFMPGRVWRVLDNGFVVVIDVGQHVTVYHTDNLVLRNDYRGNYKWKHNPGNPYGNPVRVNRMTSLRRLKKLAVEYNAHWGGYSAHGHKWSKEDQMKALKDLT